MKKIVFTLFMTIISLIVIEIISIPIYYYLNDSSLSKKKLREHHRFLQKQNENIEHSPFDASRKAFQDDVLHPYLGYVKNYDLRQIHYNEEVILPINDYGFTGEFPKDINSLKIAITGGSVAHELFIYSKSTLLDELKKSPFFKDKKIEIASLALGGMKQPQQLLTLNYFISIGVFFDIIINLDGFNEIALPLCENYPYDIALFYPRGYRTYATKSFNKEILYLISEITRSKVSRERYGKLFLSSPVKYSHFALCLYLLLDESEQENQQKFDKQVKDVLANRDITDEASAQGRGPTYKFASTKDMFAFSANLWKRTSTVMHQICKENNFQYFHFLQPNQYVTDSKVLTEWEKKNAIGDDKYCYRQGAELGYPLLMQHGETLKKQGVNFYDLTRIFKEISSDIYKDQCCHYNQTGNNLLAKEMAKIITTSIQQ